MINRQSLDVQQKALLDAIATLLKAYNEMYLSPLYVHSRTTISFEGQRYKITDIQTRWRKRHETEK